MGDPLRQTFSIEKLKLFSLQYWQVLGVDIAYKSQLTIT